MKRIIRTGVLLLLLFIAFSGPHRAAADAGTASASFPTVWDGMNWNRVYNYDFYVKRYPSVKKYYNGDKTKVLRHFVLFGMKAGWQGCKVFDVTEYRKQHPAISRLFGDDLPRYYLFYQLYGYKGAQTDLAFYGWKIMSKTVCIDPGHQGRGNYGTEPVGPGSGTRKTKVSSGTYGRYSRKNEYQVVLEIALKLQKELEHMGYKVVMTRTSHNVNISNAERAKIANKANASIFIRLHCDGQDYGSSLHGVRAMTVSRRNRYVSAAAAQKGQTLGAALAKYQAKATGQNVLQLLTTDEMTGLNWAKMPSAIIEMGYMSNPAEDRNLASPKYQDKIAKGLANGVTYYFTGK